VIYKIRVVILSTLSVYDLGLAKNIDPCGLQYKMYDIEKGLKSKQRVK